MAGLDGLDAEAEAAALMEAERDNRAAAQCTMTWSWVSKAHATK
jgi:hypothetical protein